MSRFRVHRSVQRKSLSRAWAVAAAMNELPVGAVVHGYEIDDAVPSGASLMDTPTERLIDVIYEVPE